MDLQEASDKIITVSSALKRISEITSIVTPESFEEVGNVEMVEYATEECGEVSRLWEEVQKNLPSGFSVGSNLTRHLAFNQSKDWSDIHTRDIPAELRKISEYRKRLSLIEYITTLHPEVSRVASIVLDGEIGAALKASYATFETRVRLMLKLKSSESTVPAIGKAFKDGVLLAPEKDDNDAARNFLMGVMGYYRNNILHKPLQSSRNNIYSSLSLFGLLHEAYLLFEKCFALEEK